MSAQPAFRWVCAGVFLMSIVVISINAYLAGYEDQTYMQTRCDRVSRFLMDWPTYHLGVWSAQNPGQYRPMPGVGACDDMGLR